VGYRSSLRWDADSPRTSAIAIASADSLGLVILGEQPQWTAREWILEEELDAK